MAGKVTVSGSRYAAKSGDWDSLIVRKAQNGFSVQKCFDYQPGKKEKTTPPPYLGTAPGDTLDYIEKCLGPGEHAAHEKREDQGKK